MFEVKLARETQFDTISLSILSEYKVGKPNNKKKLVVSSLSIRNRGGPGGFMILSPAPPNPKRGEKSLYGVS